MKKKRKKTMRRNNAARSVASKPASSGKWTRLGTLRKRITNAGTESAYIVLNKNFKIVNRETEEEVDLGQYMQIKLVDPTKGLESMFNNGIITEEDYNKQLDFIEEKGVKYELSVPPISE